MSSEEITSFTPQRARKKPTIEAQRAPPTMPATIASAIMRAPLPLHLEQHRPAGERAHEELPLGADVVDAAAEREREPEPDDEQRRERRHHLRRSRTGSRASR